MGAGTSKGLGPFLQNKLESTNRENHEVETLENGRNYGFLGPAVQYRDVWLPSPLLSCEASPFLGGHVSSKAVEGMC